MPSKEIEGSGIKLRLLEQKNMYDLLRLATDENVSAYVPWARFVQDRESAERQISIFQEQYESGRFARYGIFSGEQMAGYIGVWPTDEAGAYEVGFAVLPEFRGKGLAGQALNMVEQEVAKIGADKIIGHVDESNSASAKVLEKHGFISTNQFNQDNERRYEKHLK